MRWGLVRRRIEQLRPSSILEIGCGQGAFGSRLAKQARYLGVEPDPTSFAVASKRIAAAGGEVRNCTAEALDPDRQFDLVCAFEVLEHLEDDLLALKSWRELVAPGGHILVSMPAWQERFNQWDTMVGHYRRYSPEQCREVLTAAGFTQVEVALYGWPLGYATETIRGRVAAKRGSASEDGSSASMDQRTARSGRVLQPKALAGIAVHAATLPFVGLQRLRPSRGTGVIAQAARG